MTGIERIAAERKRQIEQEGWTPEHDDQHHNGELSHLAQLYATVASMLVAYSQAEQREPVNIPFPVEEWPVGWSVEWWKPSADPRRNLEKAGALIAAELDRIERCGVAMLPVNIMRPTCLMCGEVEGVLLCKDCAALDGEG